MIRLFVAVDLPEGLRDQVAEIGRGLTGARRVPREQLHLTLRFIGEVEDKVFKAALTALKEIKAPPFKLALKGLGHFPPGKHPKVFWAGLERSVPLLELQKQVELTLTGVGIAPEEKKFSPHLTLARLKETPADVVSALEEHYREFGSGPFKISEFHLYSSILTRTGAIHKREATYRLLPY